MQVEKNGIDYNLIHVNSKDVFPLSLLKSIESIVKNEGYITYDIGRKRLDTGGGNYLGDLYEVEVKGKTADGYKETNIFIKNIIPGETLKMLSVTEVYLRELYTYTELFKIYNELQIEAGVPIEERFKTVKSFDSNPEAIFLENMTNKGFTTGERMDVMSLKFTELSIQQLAKFHGLSYILQKRKPEYFNSKLKVIESPFRTDDDVWMDFISNMCKTSLRGIKSNQKERISKEIPSLIEKYKLFFKDTSFGCICHCDYRQNNILMNHTNGEATEVVPVDYQLIHYGCPLNDFFYFIFIGTDREFRRKHLTDIKNMYYDSLERFLGYFDLDVNVIFPRREFERMYKERLYYGLIVELLSTSFIMSIEEKYCDNNLTDKKDLLLPSILKSIDLIVKKEGYITHELHTKKISSEGGSYLGILYEVDVKGKTADGEKDTNIFIKQIIINETFKAVDLADAYLKESYVYTELFEIFRDLQTQANVPVKERFNNVKSFYSDADALYFENMSKKGFRTLDRLEVMSLKYAEACVQQLARYHGLSFVLQEKNPDYFDRKLKPMKTAMPFNKEWNEFAMRCSKAAMECLEETKQEIIRKDIPSLLEKYKLYTEADTARCLCHCDYRQTNILMNEIDGELEVIPIDYQLINFGTPITDFVFFIINGTDQEFRRKHLTDLKNMYYDTLKQFLKYFDMNINIVFPRKEFETEYEEKLDFGLVVALSLMPFFFNSKETVANLSTDDASTVTIKVDNIFKERFRGIVDDYVQWGYL